MHSSTACEEVLDGVLLFVGLQSSASSGHQPRVSLAISAEEETSLSWSARVDASDLGVYYLDGSDFITKLYTSCGAGGRGEEGRELSLLSRTIGDYSSVHRHTGVFLRDTSHPSSAISIEECVLPRPPDFPPYGLQICLQMGRCRLEDMKREAQRILSHMHLLHLTSPHVEMELAVEAGNEVLISRQFPREPGWQPLPSSHFRLTLSMHHFTSVATRQTRLRMARGASYSLAGQARRDGSPLSLRVNCSAAVAPHLSLPRGRKIPANRVCQQLQVYVFGPGGLPLSRAGSLTLLSLSSLADWETYRLSLTPHHSSPEGAGGVVSSGYCHLSDSQRSSEPGAAQRSAGVSRDCSLLLFVYLEETGSLTATGGGVANSSTGHWGERMGRVCELREMVERLLQSQMKKFRQASHSALNKVLCNYGTHNKTVSVLRSGLPQLASAVASIIRQSSNHNFKQKCQETLKRGDQQECEEECIADMLWEIAEKKLQVSKTATKLPQEPVSPELEQAASEDRGPPATTTTPTTPTTPTSYSHAPSSPGPQGVAPTDEPLTQPNSASQPLREDSPGPHTFSLFEAAIVSRRAKRSCTQSSASTSVPRPAEAAGEGVSSMEVNSFDALAEVEMSPDQLCPEQDRDLTCSQDSDLTAAEVTPESPGQFPEESQETLFEELAAAEAEDCLEPHPSTLLEEAAEMRDSTGLTGSDGDDSATEMLLDWGEETDDGELLQDMEDWFSDLESCSESEEEIATEDGRKGSSTKEPLSKQAAVEVSRKLSSTTTDTDWEMLGEMTNEADHTHWQVAPAKPAVAQEPTQTQMDSVSILEAATVPDINCSFTDIDEEDFHWE